MRAIFIDESATSSGSHYCLGGLVTDAAALRHIERELDGLAAFVAEQTADVDPGIELHGHDVFHGKAAWKSVPIGLRVRTCEVASKILAQSGAQMFFRGVDVTALHRRYTAPYPAHEVVLSHLLGEIDRHLGPGRPLGTLGLCHADEHHSAGSGRRNLRRFKMEAVPGHTRRPITNIGGTIYFGPSMPVGSCRPSTWPRSSSIVTGMSMSTIPVHAVPCPRSWRTSGPSRRTSTCGHPWVEPPAEDGAQRQESAVTAGARTLSAAFCSGAAMSPGDPGDDGRDPVDNRPG